MKIHNLHSERCSVIVAFVCTQTTLWHSVNMTSSVFNPLNPKKAPSHSAGFLPHDSLNNLK